VNKTIARCIFITASGIWLLLSITEPWVLSDQNTFLKNFVSHEVLNVLGVIMTITLASTANLHLELNRIENAVKKPILNKTRAAVKHSAFSMIICFALAVVAVVVKPHLPKTEIAISLVNGSALLIVLFNILVLADLTKLAFSIRPLYQELSDEKGDESG
jgi:hypothetical protein